FVALFPKALTIPRFFGIESLPLIVWEIPFVVIRVPQLKMQSLFMTHLVYETFEARSIVENHAIQIAIGNEMLRYS
ncbi:hypothetical protein PFISCL1PPCAC_21295, partial [Pristionchus fissidentatus]